MVTTNEDADEWPNTNEWTGDEGDHYRRPLTGDERPTETIVTAVAAVTEQSPLEMAPLYGVVDPDALDVLCRGNSNVATRFQYEGCEVHVGSGSVRVRELVKVQG